MQSYIDVDRKISRLKKNFLMENPKGEKSFWSAKPLTKISLTSKQLIVCIEWPMM